MYFLRELGEPQIYLAGSVDFRPRVKTVTNKMTYEAQTKCFVNMKYLAKMVRFSFSFFIYFFLSFLLSSFL
jgi:hypothetical protein